ncbi:hypothetical protein [Mesotoga sp. HF07.pep.5.2.highcov]|jgi:hypothetical protein|uniref:hypothetical protein n=1 Tax=Mesotoga sp. HF07.pep.5.2.highcov TaxID=1462923 RepID=UPI0016011D5B|nr:hypothetical protein [Mesotoga sp. HF07.pep.5.2.highcov]
MHAFTGFIFHEREKRREEERERERKEREEENQQRVSGIVRAEVRLAGARK